MKVPYPCCSPVAENHSAWAHILQTSYRFWIGLFRCPRKVDRGNKGWPPNFDSYVYILKIYSKTDSELYSFTLDIVRVIEMYLTKTCAIQ